MLHKSYLFWLVIASLGCLVAERLIPWRKDQKLFRPQFGQDVFWLVFNGLIWSMIIAFAFANIMLGSRGSYGNLLGEIGGTFKTVSRMPLLAQAFIYLVLADIIEYFVHNALHRVGFLWKIHRVHHSITTMDWIGNFRFHWGEHIVYKTIKWFPLVILGARYDAMLIAWVTSTVIGHLNHSNLNISWGPLRYILNSPRMHIWHHEKNHRGSAGVNFAVVFSLWDWVFGTAYMPMKGTLMPEAIGFRGQEKVPKGLLHRFFVPWVNRGSCTKECI